MLGPEESDMILAQSSPTSGAGPGLGPGENLVLDLVPAWRSIFLEALGWLVFAVVLVCVGMVLVVSGAGAELGVWLFVAAVGIALGALAWRNVVRRSRRYLLTNQRICAEWGVFRRGRIDAPLSRVQHCILDRSPLERLLGTGTIGLSTSGSGGPQVVWSGLDESTLVFERVRDAVLRYAGHDPAGRSEKVQAVSVEYPKELGESKPLRSEQAVGPSLLSAGAGQRADDAPSRPVRRATRMPVIGLAGGIGAGKSSVARAFEKLGCYVIDSDERARVALDLPEVRAELVRWWGSILGEDGRVDRSKVAGIVFKEPAQRARLEQLVHPIVRQDRARMISEAARVWAVAVIVDAPLLFEASIDKECDVVVFVDAPLEDRLARVRDRRGWTEEELARRELAQWPLERKRAGCQYVVNNGDRDGDAQDRVRAVLHAIVQEVDGRADASSAG